MLLPTGLKVFLALGYTDMRKSINGLSVIIEQFFTMNTMTGDLFVFCNRAKTIIKVLYWDKNGFCLWHKRLEKHQFKWPRSNEDMMEINSRELLWLLDGFDLKNLHNHEAVFYSGVT